MIVNYKVFLLFILNIISGVGYSLIAPLYPSIALERGLSEFNIGFIISVYAITNMVITPFSHLVFKKFGKKKTLLYAIIAEVIIEYSILNRLIFILNYFVNF